MTPTFFTTLETEFAGISAAIYPQLSIYFDNIEVDATLSEWVVLHIMASEDALPINLGREAKSRNVGVLQIDVFTPKGTGSGRGRSIAWNLARRFSRREIFCGVEGLCTLKDPTIERRGLHRGRDKQMASIPYRYDFDPDFV